MKKRIVTEKQLKNLDTIIQVDEKTYYVPRESAPTEEPYMVFNSINISWCCDCMNFTLNMKGSGAKEEHQCKHIRAVKKKYNL